MIEFIKSAVKIQDYPVHNLNEVVIVGRSNAGKSSFINAIFNRGIAHIGKTPGKTRLLNFFDVDNRFILVDVPGYGYAKLSDKEIMQFGEMMEEYFANRTQLKLMIMIVDIRHKPSEDDLAMIEFARYQGLKVLVIANKSDKLNRSNLNKQLKVIKDILSVSDKDLIAYSTFNSEINKKQIYDYIVDASK
ncbi:MAG: ribosome biogenesis GTP-binding protein YihA/YsxC [Erysipelotrichaceae bacterium]|nr:ribosome biogenesis GTP-binding protein YihA/YsxC [Erysipelotrichaceae bacterium]